MKWLIASDLHGSAYYCKALLAAFEREGADRMVLLGDLLYHGPRNDLPRDYDPKTVTALLNEHAADILAVRGNCDADIDQVVLRFPIWADYALLAEEKTLIFVTHGHLFHLDHSPGRSPRWPRPCTPSPKGWICPCRRSSWSRAAASWRTRA